MIQFLKIHDRTASGNTTELTPEMLARIKLTPCLIGLLYDPDQLIGTIFTFMFQTSHISTPDTTAWTAYTTLLCVHNSYRDRGLAMILIRATTIAIYTEYGSNDGYYLTAEIHHPIHNKIEAWYRPVNVKRALAAGFELPTFQRPGARGSTLARQELAYRIPKPPHEPLKAGPSDYGRVLKLLRQGSFFLAPTYDQYIDLTQAFDIYIVGTTKLLILFPMTTLIGETGRRVRNLQVALMIGDALGEALWIAQIHKYDLVYGWCVGAMTGARIDAIKGLVALGSPVLEFYNIREPIPNSELRIPIF
jgi:hypothetical protein